MVREFMKKKSLPRIFYCKRGGLITFGGRQQSGFQMARRCESCRKRLFYSENYDAAFCAGCNEWMEPKCTDLRCSFCSNRPDTPAEAGKEVDQTYENVVAHIVRSKRRRVRHFLTLGKQWKT